jgi:hypothetical protein
MLNVKHVIMIQEIKNILKDYTNKEIVFNEAHNQLCDLHNVMLRSRNKWRTTACFLFGYQIGDLIGYYLFLA